MRVAHCTDLHLLSLEGARVLDFANKRWIGGLNLLTNRGRHYHTHVFEAMVADFEKTGVDHLICTGDVTNLALEQEFLYARACFDRIALGAAGVTVIPGNHDAYVAQGTRYFSEIFADYCRSDDELANSEPWPLVRVRGPLAIIGLSTSLQTPWFTAWGRIGEQQLDRLRAWLLDPRLAGKLRIVALHHPPVGKAATNRIRGLHDWARFAQLIAEHGAELVIHGHEHRDMRHTLPGPNLRAIPVLGVQSGTYFADRPERTARYRIFEIDEPGGLDAAAGRRPQVSHHWLRRWDQQACAFVDDDAPGAAEDLRGDARHSA